MIEVYREIECVLRESILHIERNNNEPSKVEKYITTCPSTFTTEFVSNNLYDDVTIDLQLFPNLKNYLKIDRVAVKINKEDSSDIYYAFIGGMFMANYNTKVKDVVITPVGIDSIQSMKRDTGVFLTIKLHYDNDRIIKEIGTGCHNYMLHLYDIIDYYSYDNNYINTRIEIKDKTFENWLDTNRIDIYNISDDQKIMFELEKDALYEQFTF